MAYPTEFLDEIRARVSLESVISKSVKLTKKGRAECDSINATANRQYGEIFSTIPEADQGEIARSLSQFLQALTHYYMHHDILECDCDDN